MIHRLKHWLGIGNSAETDARREWVSRQHERTARRAIVTGVDTAIRCDDAKDAIEALLRRMEERNAGDDT